MSFAPVRQVSRHRSALCGIHAAVGGGIPAAAYSPFGLGVPSRAVRSPVNPNSATYGPPVLRPSRLGKNPQLIDS